MRRRKVKWKPWTEAENQRLRDDYHKLGSRVLSRELDRSIGSIRIRAAKLGVQKITEEDDQVIRDNYEERGPKWISVNLLPHLTYNKIKGRAQKMGLKYKGKMGLRVQPVYYLGHSNSMLRAAVCMRWR